LIYIFFLILLKGPNHSNKSISQ